MRRRCQHQWEETARFKVQPLDKFSADRVPTSMIETMRDAMFGFTTVHLKCSVCGDVESRKLRGVAP